MPRSRVVIGLLCAVPVVLGAAGCRTTFERSPGRQNEQANARPALFACPDSTLTQPDSAVGVAQPGSPSQPPFKLSHRGHTLTVPAPAITRPVRFVLTAEPGPQIVISITADGQHSFPFQPGRPARLDMSYARCVDRERLERLPNKQIFRILGPREYQGVTPEKPDPELMARYTIGGRLDHLSRYIIGTNQSDTDSTTPQ